MKTLRVWLLRLKGLFGKERREAELALEIESHFARHIAQAALADLILRLRVAIGHPDQEKANAYSH